MDTYLQDFCLYLETKKRLSENTIVSYERDLKYFFKFLKDESIEDVTLTNNDNVISYLLYLQESGKVASTISRNIASIKAFFKFLKESGVIQVDPSQYVIAPKVEKKKPKILTLKEVEILLEQPDTSDIKGIRDRAMLEVLYATGIKVTELTSLKVGDVNLNLQCITCNSSRKERIIPIGSKAIEALTIYLKDTRDILLKDNITNFLFLNFSGKPMTRQGFWKIIKSYAQKAKIETLITPQVLRHSFGAHLVANGADLHIVQEVMGHSYISTTQIYMNFYEAKLKDVYAKTHPRY